MKYEGNVSQAVLDRSAYKDIQYQVVNLFDQYITSIIVQNFCEMIFPQKPSKQDYSQNHDQKFWTKQYLAGIIQTKINIFKF